MPDPLHPKLAAAYAAIPPPKHDSDVWQIAIARGLLCGYHLRWIDEVWQVEAVEQEFRVPLVNPNTGRRSRLFYHAGKFDGIVTARGDPFLLEHKTCSEDISPGSPYWKRLAIDMQISGYMLASWLLGRKLSGVVYDVIRKPEIRPKKLSLKETFELKGTGNYFGRELSSESFHAFSLDENRRETPEMFEARLAFDATARPEWYFGRQVVQRLDRELLTFAEELWQVAQDIRHADKTNERRRNDRACFDYWRACEYLDLCAGHSRLESIRWQKLPTVHPELEDIDHDGSRLLTHSRLTCFQQCRRKHHYRYQLGLTSGEKAPALSFGHLIHEALAAWWQSPDGVEVNGRLVAHASAPQPHSAACCARMG